MPPADRRRHLADRRAALTSKSAAYRAIRHFTDLRSFVAGGGQKGVQRPVLPLWHACANPPGWCPSSSRRARRRPAGRQPARRQRPARLSPSGCAPTSSGDRIAPNGDRDGRIVTTPEGEPRACGHRVPYRGFSDIEGMESQPNTIDSELIEALLGKKNELHNIRTSRHSSTGAAGSSQRPAAVRGYLLNPFRSASSRADAGRQPGRVAVIGGLRRAAHLTRRALSSSSDPSSSRAIAASGEALARKYFRTRAFTRPRRCLPSSSPRTGQANSVAHNLDAVDG